MINTAIPGYNTVIQTELLERKALAYDPNLVLVLFVGNDLSLPHFIRVNLDPFARGSLLWDFVHTRVAWLSHAIQSNADPLAEHWGKTDPSRLPPQFRPLIGKEAFQRAMERLVELSSARGFELLVVSKGGGNHRSETVLKETTERLGVDTFYLASGIEHYMESEGIESWRGSPLSVARDDPHPSAIGHALYARLIREYMYDSGLVARVQSR